MNNSDDNVEKAMENGSSAEEKIVRHRAFSCELCSKFYSPFRLIRLRDAPHYVAMDRNRFNDEVRPFLIDIPIGSHGIAFDLLDLDAWIEQYKQRSGRPGIRRREWDVNEHQDSIKEETPGTLTNKPMESAFQKAVAQIPSKRRKDTLPAD
jgi:hypothetical protein